MIHTMNRCDKIKQIKLNHPFTTTISFYLSAIIYLSIYFTYLFRFLKFGIKGLFTLRRNGDGPYQARAQKYNN